jgi:acetyltransferase
LADRAAYCAFAQRLNLNDLRLRFAGPFKVDDARLATRFLDIDHVREEAFAAFDASGAILGVARMVRISPAEADIALIVRSDRKRLGIGRLLLGRLIRHARQLGLSALVGDVLYENHAMRALAAQSGFRAVGAPGILLGIRLDLAAGGAAPLAGAAARGDHPSAP